MFGRVLMALLVLTLPGQRVMAGELLQALQRAAPELQARALQGALQALHCVEHGMPDKASRLAVIDYSRPSLERRLWVFDLTHRQLLLREFVAHGRQSGEFFAERFSNLSGSHQSSLGLFRGAESYRGRHGYSLRLDGLEPGLNDQARARAIVIHGASYVDPGLIASQGRIGRSLGCPAVSTAQVRWLVDSLKDGQYLYAWHPRLEAPDCAAMTRLVAR